MATTSRGRRVTRREPTPPPDKRPSHTSSDPRVLGIGLRFSAASRRSPLGRYDSARRVRFQAEPQPVPDSGDVDKNSKHPADLSENGRSHVAPHRLDSFDRHRSDVLTLSGRIGSESVVVVRRDDNLRSEAAEVLVTGTTWTTLGDSSSTAWAVTTTAGWPNPASRPDGTPKSRFTTSPEFSIQPVDLVFAERRVELFSDLLLTQPTGGNRYGLANRRPEGVCESF